MRSLRGKRLAVLGLSVVLVGLAVGMAVQVRRVHDQGWEWRLTPSAAPPKIHFSGRDYDRGGLADDASLDGETRQGRTPGGGVIYAEPGGATSEPIIIHVRGDGRLFVYGLMGGP